MLSKETIIMQEISSANIFWQWWLMQPRHKIPATAILKGSSKDTLVTWVCPTGESSFCSWGLLSSWLLLDHCHRLPLQEWPSTNVPGGPWCNDTHFHRRAQAIPSMLPGLLVELQPLLEESEAVLLPGLQLKRLLLQPKTGLQLKR